jgi:hypothetical protein
MTSFICFFIGIAFGLFLAMFLYGWLDEREDPYAGINIPQVETTCIDWTLRKSSMEKDKESVFQSTTRGRRPGGHLGHIDHKARERFIEWIKIASTD